jgi:hypothetical protein
VKAPARILGVAVVAMGFGLATAQTPDVNIQLNAIGSYVAPATGTSQFRYYSLFGTPSIASVRLTFETGFSAFVSQRLERIPHDGDPDQLDQAYFEDEGIWRVGKQVLPFGSLQVLRESAVAARADAILPWRDVPLALAICDSGPGRQRGVVGRLGPPNYGLSFAVGEHFGISGSSLTEIRTPSETPGIGQGWDDALGADITRRIGHLRLRLEGLVLRNGSGHMDPDLSLLDISATFKEAPFDSIVFGYTREVTEKLRIFRVLCNLPLVDKVAVTPFVRFRDARLWDIGFEIQVRL